MKRKLINLTYQGITMNINQWALYTGTHRGMLRNRFNNWPVDEIFKGTRIEGKTLKEEEVRSTVARIVHETKIANRPNCKICGEPVRNYSNNQQKYCRYTKEEQKRYQSEKSPCQLRARITTNRSFKGRPEHKAIRPMYSFKERSCVGILSVEGELGPHTFQSTGIHHRVCEDCHAAASARVLSDRPFNKLILRSGDLRKGTDE